MSHLKQIASNTTIQLFGRAIGTMFGVLTIAVITRALGPTGYGEFTIALIFLSVAATIADFGFTLTTTQMISEKNADQSKIVSNAFTARLISGGVFFTLAVIAALLTSFSPTVKATIAVGAFSFFFMTSSQMLIGVFQKNLAMWRPSIAEAVSRLLILILIIVFAYKNYGVTAMMAAFTTGNLLLLIMNYAFTLKFTKVTLRIDTAIQKEFLKRSWPIAISTFFNLLYLKGDILFMHFFGTGIDSIGLYGASYKVLDVISVIPTMFMGLILPLLVTAWTSKTNKKFHELLQQAFDFFSLSAFPLLAGTLVLATPIMTLVSGNEFAASGPLLKILMVANTIVFFGILFGHVIVSINKQKLILPAYFLTAAISTILYIIYIPKFGATGAAWTTVASEIIIATLTTSTVIYFTKFRPKLKNTIIYIISSIIMAISIQLTLDILTTPSNWQILALITESVLIYTLAVLSLGGIKKETIKLILNKQ